MSNSRLIQLYVRLLSGEPVTAAALAEELGASERTIYRDVQRLMEAGLSLQGAVGVGYRLRELPALPPLLLSVEEVRALVAGAYAVRESGDEAVVRGAAWLLDKLRAMVPPRSRARYGLKS